MDRSVLDRIVDRPAPGTTVPRKFRPELQGLRALAAFLVVVYHVWLGRISGGVDVFFLISGFLITGQLYRARSRGAIEFRPMWGRMIKRLFPAALTVLAAVIALSLVLLPEYRWFQTVREVVAAALYVENWQLAADSVDYFAQHNTASLVQHYWSLSIQGQFYVVWPLLVALVGLVAARSRLDLWWSLLATMAIVCTGSLAFSVYLTTADQPLAYFHSATRIWEFALGGLLVLVIDRVVLPKPVALVLGWAGVVGVAICGLVLRVGSVFPGYLALWPTVAAALVIAAGATGSAFGADRFLSSRPLVYLGNLSFALYLWHWPILLLYLVARDRPAVGPLGGAFVIGASLLLAVLTYHFVEEPVRRSAIGTQTRWGAYRFGVLTLAVLLAMAGGWQLYGKQQAASSAVSADNPLYPGAQALRDGRLLPVRKAKPAPAYVALGDDWIVNDSATCTSSARNAELRICPTAEPAPVKRIVLIGESHAEQFLGALRPYAQTRHWQVLSMLRGGCPFALPPGPPTDLDAGCVRRNRDAIAEIVEMRPDAVVTVGSREVRRGLTENIPSGYVEAWRQLAAHDIPVIALRDNPRFTRPPVTCVQNKGADAPACATPRAHLYADPNPFDTLPNRPEGVYFVDTSDYFCDASTCPPVIGNVIVYMDDNHISGTYMATVAPALGADIEELLRWD
ncbi:MAG TPA: acyltransferase family protein [Actinophytocola sp.]|uniref:acyltransferase family protein n=1 Tax=Actinophytocola sp. TaxID=1872138 RepID=UPI002F938C39